jgi:cobalamin biosynthesis protein CobW
MANRLSHHEMEGEVQHDHDDFVTFIVELPDALKKETLLQRINEAIADHDILRLKGFANVAGSQSRLLVQAVGPRLNSYFDRPWHNDERRLTRLIVIGEKTMNQSAIEAALRG